MNIKDMALYYRSVGLMPIPVKEKSSVISWKGYQEQLASEGVIEGWFNQNPSGGVALVTGPVSNTIVLDLDGSQAIEQVKKFPFPKTWIAKTKKGYHYYFQWDATINVSTTLTKLNGMEGVDIRGRGGYVVAPPSYGVYAWLDGYAPWQVNLVPLPEWLRSFISQHQQKINQAFPATGQTPEIGWLSEILEGVGEGDRHASLVRLAGYYFSRMPYDVTENLLLSWNEKNDPPMDEKELRFQIRDIGDRYKRGQYQSNFTPHDLSPMMPEVKPLIPVNVNHFLDSDVPSITWDVHHLIPEKTITILSGWHGVGKSWSMLDLAIEMAKGGGKWFDYLPVSGGSVLYIDEESAPSLLKSRIEKLVTGKHLKGYPLNLNLSIGKRLKFTNPNALNRIKKLIEETKPRLVIIDALMRVHNLEENSSKDMAYFFDDIIKPLVQEYKCGFLIADHEGKGAPGMQADGSHRLRGSAAKGDTADTTLSLKRTPQYLLVEHSKARFGKRIPTFAVSIDDIAYNATVVRCLGQFGG